MVGLRLFTSNQLEILADKLAEILKTPLASPFDSEIIVVQSRGMERWISLQLALRLGVCANIRFPFPNHFIYEMFQKIMPNLPDIPPFNRNILTWRLMKHLPLCIKRQEFEQIRHYFKDHVNGLKLFQLAEQIANVFDQYLLFRPEMIIKWENGHDDHWQAVLWRELIIENGNRHQARLGIEFFRAVEAPSPHIHHLPERISVFGISSLPRYHIQIIAAISRLTQVDLYIMNPCREYWGDIVSEWEIEKKAVHSPGSEFAFNDLHLEKGNALLASMGALGRGFFDLINEFPLEEAAVYKDPEEDHLLSRIQSDILRLQGAPFISNEKGTVAPNDSSIQIHSCHSPMREMEVLRDQLLLLFENNPDLTPSDILVMTPDIETYAPYIQAVFDLPFHKTLSIPYSIADRNIRNESHIIESFFSILNLKRSRFSVVQVLAILECKEVQCKFNLTEKDIDLIRRWIKETRIQWGVNEKSLADLGFPSSSENTWQAGLERLLIGYALPGNNERFFEKILPYDHVEGTDALVLGKCCDYTDKLFAFVLQLENHRTLKDWSVLLKELMDTLFLSDENSEMEMQIIRTSIGELESMQDLASFDEKIDLNSIRCHLEHAFERQGFGFGFITGGVTFCAMLPMRSIPFKVICLVGMNNDTYPRQAQPMGFDLMAAHPQRGDRSIRNDDRYLFLETLLSARRSLYISYVGQSIKDNSPIQPSVLVNELLDYIEQGFQCSAENILDVLFTKHRLQAFSPKYFMNHKKKMSFSREHYDVAVCQQNARKYPKPLIGRGLSVPEETCKVIDINDLCRFFNHPSRFILEKRLGIFLEDKDIFLDDAEAFDLSALDRYALEQAMVKKKIDGSEVQSLYAIWRSSGQLPHGVPGECIFDSLAEGAARFADNIGPYLRAEKLPPMDFKLPVDDMVLMGQIDSVYKKRIIKYRYTQIKPKDFLFLWIHHLVLNCLGLPDFPRTSFIAGLKSRGSEFQWEAFEFTPIEDSREILKTMLSYYWAGLIKPLHFFPRSSWNFALMFCEKGKTKEDSLKKAQYTWQGDAFISGECQDPHYERCFGSTNPLDADFEQISTDIFGQILKYRKTIG